MDTQEKQKLAEFHSRVLRGKSSASGAHGGTKQQQRRARRREGKQEARES